MELAGSSSHKEDAAVPNGSYRDWLKNNPTEKAGEN
jgi:hypothetical protein